MSLEIRNSILSDDVAAVKEIYRWATGKVSEKFEHIRARKLAHQQRQQIASIQAVINDRSGNQAVEDEVISLGNQALVDLDVVARLRAIPPLPPEPTEEVQTSVSDPFYEHSSPASNDFQRDTRPEHDHTQLNPDRQQTNPADAERLIPPTTYTPESGVQRENEQPQQDIAAMLQAIIAEERSLVTWARNEYRPISSDTKRQVRDVIESPKNSTGDPELQNLQDGLSPDERYIALIATILKHNDLFPNRAYLNDPVEGHTAAEKHRALIERVDRIFDGLQYARRNNSHHEGLREIEAALDEIQSNLPNGTDLSPEGLLEHIVTTLDLSDESYNRLNRLEGLKQRALVGQDAAAAWVKIIINDIKEAHSRQNKIPATNLSLETTNTPLSFRPDIQNKYRGVLKPTPSTTNPNISTLFKTLFDNESGKRVEFADLHTPTTQLELHDEYEPDPTPMLDLGTPPALESVPQILKPVIVPVLSIEQPPAILLDQQAIPQDTAQLQIDTAADDPDQRSDDSDGDVGIDTSDRVIQQAQQNQGEDLGQGRPPKTGFMEIMQGESDLRKTYRKFKDWRHQTVAIVNDIITRRNDSTRRIANSIGARQEGQNQSTETDYNATVRHYRNWVRANAAIQLGRPLEVLSDITPADIEPLHRIHPTGDSALLYISDSHGIITIKPNRPDGKPITLGDLVEGYQHLDRVEQHILESLRREVNDRKRLIMTV